MKNTGASQLQRGPCDHNINSRATCKTSKLRCPVRFCAVLDAPGGRREGAAHCCLFSDSNGSSSRTLPGEIADTGKPMKLNERLKFSKSLSLWEKFGRKIMRCRVSNIAQLNVGNISVTGRRNRIVR